MTEEIPHDELQRRALLNGIDASQSVAQLKRALGIAARRESEGEGA